MKTLKRALIASMFVAMTPFAAQAEDVEVSGDIGAYSQYVWRGVSQTAGKSAIQGDIGASMGGFSASAWFSNAYASPAPQFAGKDTVEFDWTADYSGSFDKIGYSIGGIWYTYLYDSASNFGEVYTGISYDAPVSPSATIYYNVGTSKNKAYMAGDLWIDLGLSGSAAGYDLGATVSYAKWKKDAISRPIAAVNNFKDGFNLVSLSVSKDVTVGDSTLTASITGSAPIISKASDGVQYIYGVAASKEVVFGVNFAY
jgi:uncharacterized protein (TIGR02001 family)